MLYIEAMEKSDYLDIDGQQIRLLLTIQQTGSLSSAAKLLDMNQSTVSYWLDIMRKRFGDPLFVRQGNGVVATERAMELFPVAEELLTKLKSLFETQTYDPGKDEGVLRIEGSSIERNRLIRPLTSQALKVAPRLRLELRSITNIQDTVENLISGNIDVAMIPPLTAEREGLLQRVLLRTKDVIFFDPSHPLEEGDLDAYCNRPHVRIGSGKSAGFDIDRWLAGHGRKRHIAVQASDFDTALDLIRDTPLIATLPETLSSEGIENVPPMWPQQELDLALVWHMRNHSSSRHKYWRETLADISKAEK